jgi:phosphoesterase RecJ-like protein
MNYSESNKILEKIKSAKNILINCHRSPDPDSVGSALSMYIVLRQLGKEVKIIGPDKISPDLSFLPFSEKIEKIDFSKFSFKSYDLFILLDSGSSDLVTGSKEISLPKIFSIVIDHHKTNDRFGDINLVKPEISSSAEILYHLFEDWEVEINQDLANCLLTGIIGDTGIFQFPNTTQDTFEIASKLMKLGADKKKIVFNVYQSIPLDQIKIWGEILQTMILDKEFKFVYSAISYEDYEKYGKPQGAKETAASMFAQIIKDTNFGMVMVEEKKNTLYISFRSRTGFDVSKIAAELGGGGHIAAAGARVDGPFEKTVKKVLETARKHAKKQ